MPVETNHDESRAQTLLQDGRKAFQQGDYKNSLINLMEAFMIAPTNSDIQAAFLDVLSCTSGYSLPQALTDALTKVCMQSGQNIQALAMVQKNQMDQDETTQILIAFLARDPHANLLDPAVMDVTMTLFSDLLLQVVATRTTAISEPLEALFTLLRRRFLTAFSTAEDADLTFIDTFQPLLPLLACQAYNTEYIYDVTAEEEAQLAQLLDEVMADPAEADTLDIALIACYQPIINLALTLGNDIVQNMIEDATEKGGAFPFLWQNLYIESLQELLFKQKIEALTPIREGMSAAMSLQYETYPYPRWQSAKQHEATSLKSMITERFGPTVAAEIPDGPVNILYAGCGTGQQIVELGTSILSKNALAIDLSLASLAYAQRKITEHGLMNVHFGQADILAIPSWDARFDFIACTGVLHHMADPAEGLKALVAVSHPHSIFQLALYSERARAAVVAARQYIEKENMPDTAAGIRRIRAYIRALPANHPMKPIQHCREFFSTSGLHDYIFNTHEIRFTPLQLEAFLAKEGLQFLGFDLERGEFAAKYRAKYPDDPGMQNLANWDAFEKNNPNVFGGMMQFWCKRL